jgi:hypothetical protein
MNYLKNVNIKVLWDDDGANIERDHSTDDFKVKITSRLYNKMDPLFKLDFMSDMEEWVQQEINRIHKDELNEDQRFLYPYLMRTPKSSEQLNEEDDKPGLREAREERAREIHIKIAESYEKRKKEKNA